MKILRLLIIICLLVGFGNSVYATDFDDIYKQWGNYQYVVVPGLRVYYPEKIKESIPRIIAGFSNVRKRVIDAFMADKDFEATVILNDHDDSTSSTADSGFDLINLSIIDEMDLLSARTYSLEKRFALSLAKTLVKRSTSNVSFAWRRSLALLLVPHWYVEGMALNYAFPIDSIHYSRLLDMARHGRLYNLDDLNTMTSQAMLVKEEMLFQAHSMLSYWESVYKKGADLEIVKSIIRNPRGFEAAFKKYYGVSLKEAFNSYVKYVSQQSTDLSCALDTDLLDVDYDNNNNKIFRSYNRISDTERIWVSSKRYTTENYDLYYRNGIQKPVILLKNVHPTLIYNHEKQEIYIGKYSVNGHRQKRLSLFAVKKDGSARCVVSDSGSFKPLAVKDEKVYFTNVKDGIVKIMSVGLLDNSVKEEVSLGFSLRPLDLTLDIENKRVFFTYQENTFTTNIAVLPIESKKIEEDLNVLFKYDGDINCIRYIDDKLWCACDHGNSTTQLFAYDEQNKQLLKYSDLIGGVWDIVLTDPEKKKIEVATLHKGGFAIASINIDHSTAESFDVSNVDTIEKLNILKVNENKYKTEFHTSLWKPVLGKDAEGYVLGLYNLRTDLLDRTSILVAPTYGLKSHKWGYTSNFMRRYDLLKVSLSFNDNIIRKDYLETDYYERVKSRKLTFEYPLKLDMKLSFGLDLADRGIAKVKKNPRNVIPSEGKDHYYFVELSQKAIRTEPYNNIFPRKGRKVELAYKYGNDSIFGGDLIYDSISLKWNEYIPVNDAYVLTLGSWIAQDDKHNGIRRPDDLSLGSDEYMRAFDSCYKTGDKLRYFSLTLARPIVLELPKQISWIRNEFSSLGVFAEIGDTTNDGDFKYCYDRGLEFSSSLLLFKRIPISFKAGYAVRNGQKGHGTYCNFFMDDFSEILKM